MESKSDIFIVSFDHSHGDIPVLIVGRKEKEKEEKEINIVSAFQGDEAQNLYEHLIGKKEKNGITERIDS